MSATGIETSATIPKKQTRDHIARLELKAILHSHQEWVKTEGKEGQKATPALRRPTAKLNIGRR